MEIRHADFERIVDPDAAFERIATGFDFTEGPVWHPGERSLIFSDILGNSIYRWTAASGLETLPRNSSYPAKTSSARYPALNTP